MTGVWDYRGLCLAVASINQVFARYRGQPKNFDYISRRKWNYISL